MTRSSNGGGRPRDRMNWDDVRVFVVVANCKSINRAAQILKVTPGMVSRRIDELESALEVRLFARTTGGMALTDAGEDMLDRALSMQRFAEAIENSVRERDQRDEGMVVVRCPDAMAGYWFAPRLGEFLEASPKIQLTLDCGDLRHEIGGEPDILITPEKSDARDGDLLTPFAKLHYVMVAAPSYLKAHGTPKSLASAAGEHRTLRHTGQVHQREHWDPRAVAIETFASFSLVSNSSAVLGAAVLAGAGICAAPSVMCRIYPSLQIVVDDLSIPIQLWMVVRREARNAARVQRVACWLHGLCDTKTNPWFRDEFVHPSRFEAELAAIAGRLAPPTPSREAAS